MVLIRKLEPKDSDQLLSLLTDFYITNEKELVSKELWPFVKYKQTDKRLKRNAGFILKLNSKKRACFVAEENGALIGFIWGNIVERKYAALEKTGFIEDWFVKEEYRNKSVGKKLWNNLLDWFKSIKCDSLELDAFVTNEKAIEIYHHLGFIDKKIVLIKRL